MHLLFRTAGITLTANGATDEVPLCPEVVSFTCTAVNLASGTLRWFHNSRDTEILELNYVYATVHTFPRQVDIAAAQSLGFMNLTIMDATFDESSNIFNYTAELVVDMDVLFFNASFRSLECGSLVLRENFTFPVLDVQGTYVRI